MQTLEKALEMMPAHDINPRARSSWYSTPALTPDRQPDYVNAVVLVETELDASALLTRLHVVEGFFGRSREKRWESRVIDIDLLDYRGGILPCPDPDAWGPEGGSGPRPLALPHPMLSSRAFVLLPLAELVPEWRHPVTGETADELLAQLPLSARQGISLLKH